MKVSTFILRNFIGICEPPGLTPPFPAARRKKTEAGKRPGFLVAVSKNLRALCEKPSRPLRLNLPALNLTAKGPKVRAKIAKKYFRDGFY